MKRSLLFILALFILPLQGEDYKPYYDYPKERLERVQKIDSSHHITKESLKKWDRLLTAYLNQKPYVYGDSVRIFSYLYTAQADFAILSSPDGEEIKGSIDPISLDIIRLFYPLFPAPKDMVTDEYSIVLTELILEKYKQGIHDERKAEQEMAHYFSVQKEGYQNLNFGKNILGWLPWYLQPYGLRITPAPPSLDNHLFWKKQLDEVIAANQKVTQEQRKIILYWGNYFKKGEGNWIHLANDFLFSEDIDLKKILYVREILSAGIYDTLIATLDAKYTYFIPPPYLRSQEIHPLIEAYQYPSYPSVHATTSSFSSALLGHFFPEHAEQWARIAEQIGQTRIWAGVNYPIDIEVGMHVGQKIFERIIPNEKEMDSSSK